MISHQVMVWWWSLVVAHQPLEVQEALAHQQLEWMQHALASQHCPFLLVCDRKSLVVHDESKFLPTAASTRSSISSEQSNSKSNSNSSSTTVATPCLFCFSLSLFWPEVQGAGAWVRLSSYTLCISSSDTCGRTIIHLMTVRTA